MKTAPKDRRFLAKNKTWRGDGLGHWTHTGFQWIEAWWDGNQYRIWCGSRRTSTTETLKFEEWSELP